MPARPTGKNSRTIGRGFIEAINDPGVRILLALTATVILGGALVYSLLEGWGFVDSIYFATVTLATVGYGDLAPQTTLGRLFTVGYIILGIGLFVALASAMADHLIRRAKQDHGYNDGSDRDDPPPSG
ncbi:potassium channel family protein [Tropicimonas sediminicola]|uniref:Ion channel n=1 Tax=Tropicimonas sediminicola TaxID=1031541 RepID=A0A239C5L9_9RHOB|nr:potassium channel family protein [Tropicimonas sediminicola]SNS14673.1 Ion channel [Tropicimonas sediminicola]